MKRPSLFSLALMLLLWSCVPYVKVEGKYTASSENFDIDLPEGWRKHEAAFDNHPISRSLLEGLQKRRDFSSDVIRITRDGLLLQQISIGRVAVDKELPHTKKKLAQGMLPQEVAEVIMDNVRSNPNITNQEVVENRPARVGGQPGFKLTYAFQTKEGLRTKVAYYGTLVDNWFYYLLYEAPARHYFEKDYQVFEKLQGSFRILKAGAA
jgi:hypothetical protein